MGDTQSVLAVASGGMSFVLVVGAFFLIYRGLVKLDPPPNVHNPTELEFMKIVKIKTNVGALVLFVLGFGFMYLGLYKATPASMEFNLAGKILGIKDANDVTIRVCGGPWPVTVTSGGTFQKRIVPDLNEFMVEVQRTGGPLEHSVQVHRVREGASRYGGVLINEDGLADLEEIRLRSVSGRAVPTPTTAPDLGAPPAFNYTVQP